MVDHEYKNWWMSLTAVLIFVGRCHCDLKLKMDRIGSESFCGHLHCWNQDKLDNATSITAIRVYNTTHPQVTMQLANVTKDGSGVEINPLSISIINAAGRINGFNANLSINFKSSQDCEFGSFRCELEFLDVNGHKETKTAEDRARSSNKCNCSSIDSQMYKLPEKVEDSTQQMSSVRQNNSALSPELAEFRQSISALSNEITGLKEKNENLTNELSALRQSNTTQSIELSALKQDIRTNNSNLSAELIVLRQIYITLSTEIADLRKVNNEVLAQISALRLTTDITALFNELLVFIKVNTNLSTEFFDLKQDQTALSTELSALRKHNTYQSTELSAVTQNLTVISTKVTDLTQNNTALSTELTALRHNNTNISIELSAVRQKNTNISIELSAVRQNNTNISIELSAVRQNITALSTTQLAVTKVNTDLSTELSDLRQQNSDLLLQFQNLSSQFSQIRDYLTSVQTFPSTTTSTTSTRITTPASVSECRRGMSHSNPRVKFLLWGQIPALCDTETDGGGWVIIQRRTKGNVDFYRDWQSYKRGFGTPDTDFWLGNDVIHNLTLRGYSVMRVDMIFNKSELYAQYDIFSVSNENQNYRLIVSGYRGDAGASLDSHNNEMFTTYDRDNDKYSYNCATYHRGGWWYENCYESNLNGAWGVNDSSGIIWKNISHYTSLTFTEMKVRLWEL